jgi:toxin ParE1/3/4
VKVEVSRQAEADITAINREGIRQFGVNQAQKYAGGLTNAFGMIAEFPLASAQRAGLDGAVRVRTYGAHVILYRIAADTVLDLRVRRVREDWEDGDG